MAGAGEAVGATMLATAIWIDGTVEGDIGGFVVGDDRARRLGQHRGGDAVADLVLVPAVIHRFGRRVVIAAGRIAECPATLETCWRQADWHGRTVHPYSPPRNRPVAVLSRRSRRTRVLLAQAGIEQRPVVLRLVEHLAALEQPLAIHTHQHVLVVAHVQQLHVLLRRVVGEREPVRSGARGVALHVDHVVDDLVPRARPRGRAFRDLHAARATEAGHGLADGFLAVLHAIYPLEHAVLGPGGHHGLDVTGVHR